jgi:hypothetical protein
MAPTMSVLCLGRLGQRALSLSMFAPPLSLLASVLHVLDLELCPGVMLPPIVPSSPGNAVALGVQCHYRNAPHVATPRLPLGHLVFGFNSSTVAP